MTLPSRALHFSPSCKLFAIGFFKMLVIPAIETDGSLLPLTLNSQTFGAQKRSLLNDGMGCDNPGQKSL
jgi:hypothetical protein